MKLKAKDIKPTREAMLAEQNNICAICKGEVTVEDAVLDHNHTTGAIREVLHRSCNSFLGKIENNYKRFGVKDLQATLSGVANYLDRHAKALPDALVKLHPTFKTPEEKKLAAKKRRAKAKLK